MTEQLNQPEKTSRFSVKQKIAAATLTAAGIAGGLIATHTSERVEHKPTPSVTQSESPNSSERFTIPTNPYNEQNPNKPTNVHVVDSQSAKPEPNTVVLTKESGQHKILNPSPSGK